MPKPKTSVDQTILYLRPTQTNTIEVLDDVANESYVYDLAPPPEPVDIPIEGIAISDPLPTTQLSP